MGDTEELRAKLDAAREAILDACGFVDGGEVTAHGSADNDLAHERADEVMAFLERVRDHGYPAALTSEDMLRGKLDQLWGWAKSGTTSDPDGGRYYLMDVGNVDGFTDNVVRIVDMHGWRGGSGV